LAGRVTAVKMDWQSGTSRSLFDLLARINIFSGRG
jgi:hypothetical protein